MGKTPLEEGMATTQVFLPGESHGQRGLGATIHGVTESMIEATERTHGSIKDNINFKDMVPYRTHFLTTVPF